MVKLLPLILLAPVARAKGIKQTLKYSGGVLLVCLIIFGPFLAFNPTMTVASLQAQASKSSYQTVWAMLDGNDSTATSVHSSTILNRKKRPSRSITRLVSRHG